jgi:hypothetical protein
LRVSRSSTSRRLAESERKSISSCIVRSTGGAAGAGAVAASPVGVLTDSAGKCHVSVLLAFSSVIAASYAATSSTGSSAVISISASLEVGIVWRCTLMRASPSAFMASNIAREAMHGVCRQLKL